MKILNDEAIERVHRVLRRLPLFRSGLNRATRPINALTALVKKCRLCKVACFALLSACITVFNSPVALAETDPRCARIDLRQAYGPFDYRQGRTTIKFRLDVVEKYHFLPKHQRQALRGDGASWFQMDYTLRAFPNHAPALFLIGVLEQKLQLKPKELEKLQAHANYSPAECYFERAIKFAPGDPNVYNAFGRVLVLSKLYDKSIDAFKMAVKLAPKSASANYNLGLAYYAAGKFDESAKAARKAYSLGYKKPQLRNRLKRNGHW